MSNYYPLYLDDTSKEVVANISNTNIYSYETDIEIGKDAGLQGQQACAIAIGFQAGMINQGRDSIAIGCQAGMFDQPSNSIILNASGEPLNATITGCFISPVRVVDLGMQGGRQGADIFGSQGFQGMDGYIGVDGLQGLQGLQGLDGIIGIDGLQGLRGLQGLQGLQGIDGLQGLQGLQGLLGFQGFQGFTGPTGFIQTPLPQLDYFLKTLTNGLPTGVNGSFFMTGDGITQYVSYANIGIYKSIDSGNNWSIITDIPVHTSYFIGGNISGSVIIITNGAAIYYISIDGGITFNQGTGTFAGTVRTLQSGIQVSDDGQVIAMGDNATAAIWVSRNGGLTFGGGSPINRGGGDLCRSITMNSDGTIIYAVFRGASSVIYSRNYGATNSWISGSNVGANALGGSIATNQTGQYVSTTNQVGGRVYTSTDYGQNYNNVVAGVAATTTSQMTLDGALMVINGGNGLWFSSNFGTTWTRKLLAVGQTFNGLAMDAIGSILLFGNTLSNNIVYNYIFPVAYNIVYTPTGDKPYAYVGIQSSLFSLKGQQGNQGQQGLQGVPGIQGPVSIDYLPLATLSYRNSSTQLQTIPNNSETVVRWFNVNVLDSQSNTGITFDGVSRFTNTSGFTYTYTFSASLRYSFGTSSGFCFWTAYRNNDLTFRLFNSSIPAVQAPGPASSSTFTVILQPNDFIEYKTYQNTGANLTMNMDGSTLFITRMEGQIGYQGMQGMQGEYVGVFGFQGNQGIMGLQGPWISQDFVCPIVSYVNTTITVVPANTTINVIWQALETSNSFGIVGLTWNGTTTFTNTSGNILNLNVCSYITTTQGGAGFNRMGWIQINGDTTKYYGFNTWRTNTASPGTSELPTIQITADIVLQPNDNFLIRFYNQDTSAININTQAAALNLTSNPGSRLQITALKTMIGFQGSTGPEGGPIGPQGVPGVPYSNPVLSYVSNTFQSITANVVANVLWQTLDTNNSIGLLGLTYNNGEFTNNSGSSMVVGITASIVSDAGLINNARRGWASINNSATIRYGLNVYYSASGTDTPIIQVNTTLVLQNSHFFSIKYLSDENININQTIPTGSRIQIVGFKTS